jgi:hypothetical protein
MDGMQTFTSKMRLRRSLQIPSMAASTFANHHKAFREMHDMGIRVQFT